jgi:hypothetical protein
VNTLDIVSDEGGGWEGKAATMLYSSLPLLISWTVNEKDKEKNGYRDSGIETGDGSNE